MQLIDVAADEITLLVNYLAIVEFVGDLQRQFGTVHAGDLAVRATLEQSGNIGSATAAHVKHVGVLADLQFIEHPIGERLMFLAVHGLQGQLAPKTSGVTCSQVISDEVCHVVVFFKK